MQTIQLKLEDNLYDDIVKSGIDIQNELKLFLRKTLYQKEQQISKNVKKGLDDVNKGNTKDLEIVLNEI